MDRSGCNYCGEDFSAGELVRDHARGAIHEHCYREHADGYTRAAANPNNTAKVRRDCRAKLAALPSHYGEPHPYVCA